MKAFPVLVMICFLAACAVRPVEEPVVIKELAHSGGSVVAFNPAGSLLASGGWEGGIRLWDVPTGKQVGRWSAHGDSVNGIAFIDDGRLLLTAGYDGRLVTWRVTGGQVQVVETPAPITHMEADTATRRAVTGHDDGSVRLWQLPDMKLLHEARFHRGSVKAVAIDPRGERYASADSKGSVSVWDGQGARKGMASPPADAWTLAFSPDGETLLGGSWFRLYRWDTGSGVLERVPTEHRGIIKSIEVLPDNAGLATISRQTDSAVYFVDPETGTVLRRFQQHDLCGGDVTVSADGRYLATTSDDASVRIWDLHKPGEIHVGRNK